jgi:NifU-like protein involved in Fe-S cluster formation
MDEVIRNYYRDLFNKRFRHFGALVNPSIFVDSTGENIYLCGTGNDFMQLHINILDGKITDMRYACFCTPTANVAVEVLCDLVIGKSLDEASAISGELLCSTLGTGDPELKKKSGGLLELMNRGIKRYQHN